MTNKELLQRFTEISETNLFPVQFGDGSLLIGLPPNDIYQLGFAAAFNECHLAVREFVDQQLVQDVLAPDKLSEPNEGQRGDTPFVPSWMSDEQLEENFRPMPVEPFDADDQRAVLLDTEDAFRRGGRR